MDSARFLAYEAITAVLSDDHCPQAGEAALRALVARVALNTSIPIQPARSSRPFGQGAETLPDYRDQPAARRPAHPTQPVVAGLVCLLPARRVQRHVQYLSSYTWRQVMKWIRRKHRRTTGRTSANATALGDGGRPARNDDCSTGESTHHALPLPGISHPLTLA
jgi:hypothetical protein